MNEAKQNNKRILICLSSSPSNARVIHAAAKLYDPQTDSLTALYIGSLEDDVSADLRLKDNILLARRCGAEVQIIESDDIVLTITGIARQMHTTDLFIGLSARSGFSHVRSIPERLIDYLPDTDIHIIPDARASAYPLVYRKNNTPVLNLRDLILVVAVMSAATLIGYWFDQSVFSNSNIVTIYILAVLIASVLTSHRVYGIIASILYILLFNFLFIDPRFTLLVYDSSYLVTYLVTFAASLLTGTLAVRLKNTARESSENAYQARILLETSDQMKYTEDTSEMIRIVCIQLEDLLKRPVSFFVCQSGEFKQDDITAEEKEILQWVADYRHQAGAYTDQWPSSEYRYLSVHSQEHCFGILRIDMKERSFTEFENTLLLSIINEFTLALTNAQVNKDKTAAEVNAEKERFRAGLLRSISHDLRTPLTSIIGNATNLVSNSTYLTEEEKQTVYEDIRSDSYWLGSQMENILSMSRLENDIPIHLNIENVNEIIEESLEHLDYRAARHIIRIAADNDDLYAEMDSRLIIQVLTNLVNNAIMHTPDGSEITISCKLKDDHVVICVADNGDGIPDDEKAHVFELFRSGEHKSTDSYRNRGIGLNLCAMILKAHGQPIEVCDNQPHGTIFRFYLKAKEIDHEPYKDPGC